MKLLSSQEDIQGSLNKDCRMRTERQRYENLDQQINSSVELHGWKRYPNWLMSFDMQQAIGNGKRLRACKCTDWE